ncbi:MAG: fumarylacetoacetate hydrolase family protein [Desulfovibrionaceae bacterium]
MRVLRVRYQEQVFYASLVGEELHCLNRELGLKSPLSLNEVGVLPPVAPTKVICLGVNYAKHGAEMGHALPEEPLLFLKPPSAIITSGQTIIRPSQSQRVDYEGELAIVVGRQCRNITPEEAAECVFGYTCANDVTARDLQKKDVQFTRGKGFDTFLPIGPWIETDVPDPTNLGIRTLVNGEIRQQDNTSQMLNKPYETLSFISRIMTLMPGDVVLTGTPEGVGPLVAGDEVRIEIDGVGILINPVADDVESVTSVQ